MKTKVLRNALKLALVLLPTGILALIGLGSSRLPAAQAASFTVCPPGSGTCGYNSIQAAVDDPQVHDGDVILVATGVYTGVSTRNGVTQTVYISKSLTIRGGYTTTDNFTTPYPITQPTTLDAQGQGRVAFIASGTSITLENLLLTGGDAGSGNGGGIYIGNAAATLSNSQVFSNTAVSGGGISSDGTLVLRDTAVLSNAASLIGGGMFLNSGNATLSGVQILSNTASFDGGGVFIGSASVTLSEGQIASNTAQFHGGGMEVNIGSVTLSGTQVLSNTANNGGGMFIAFGTATLNGGQILANRAGLVSSNGSGGGIIIAHAAGSVTMSGGQILSNTAPGNGGGVDVFSGTATMSGVQILGNTSSFGGGVSVEQGNAILRGGQIVRNTASQGGGLFSAGTTVMTDTTVSYNTGGGLAVQGGTMQVYTGTLEANGVGLTVGGTVTGSLLAYNTIISGNLTGGLVYTGTTPFTITLGGAPEQANVFRNNGPSGGQNISVSAPSSGPPIGAFYNDWGITGLTNIESTLYHQFDDLSLARVDYYTLTLDAAPASQAADGTSPVNLTATLAGMLNEPAGDVISFTTSLGTLSAPISATQSNSQAGVTLTSAVTGTAWLTATASVDPISARPGTASVFFGMPDLEIHKAVTPNLVTPGQTVTFTVTFSNTGINTFTGVVITDIVPIALTDVRYVSSGAAITPTGSVSYTWQVADLPPNATGVITITGIVSPDIKGVAGFTNTAIITGTAPGVLIPYSRSSAGVTLQYNLTVNRTGSGTGTVSNTPPGSTFNYATAVTLTATPGITSTFGGWSTNCTVVGGQCVVTMTANTQVTATFTAITRALTVNLTGTGSGNVTSSPTGINCPTGLCSTSFVTGTVVTLAATPSITATFAGWTGGGCAGTGACVVTMTANTQVTATFTAITRALTVNLTGTGSGNVTSSPAGINCPTGLCSTGFVTGTVVTLAATPSITSTFGGWTGGGCAGTGACVVTMTANTQVTATFTIVTRALTVNLTGTGSGNVTSSPVGINCPTGLCSTSFVTGTVVTLAATPSITSTLGGWSTNCTVVGGQCVVTMTANTQVTATFTIVTKALTVNLTGTGSGNVTSSPVGINCPTGLCSTSFVTGTVVTLAATPSITSTFGGWTGGGCAGTGACVVTMTANTQVTATFTAITRALTVNLTGTGSGNVTGSPVGINCPTGLCSTGFVTGTVVTLAAMPSITSTFGGWTGGGCAGTGACVVTMTANTQVTATFTIVTNTLTVNLTGTASGNVTSSPVGIDCPTGLCSTSFVTGTVVTLAATPSITSTLGGWSTNCTVVGGQCVVTMTANTQVTATFTIVTRALTVNLTGTGSGNVTSSPAGINCPTGLCSTSFVTGTVVTLAATPSITSTFGGWSTNCTVVGGQCVVTMTANTQVTATFTAITRALTVNLTGTGSGNVTSSPTGINCPTGLCSTGFVTGTVVTLTATPNASSTFTGWSGGDCTGTGNCAVFMSADTYITATFSTHFVYLPIMMNNHVAALDATR